MDRDFFQVGEHALTIKFSSNCSFTCCFNSIGTGSCFEVGEGKGRHHNLNIPLLDGVNDKLFAELVQL